MIPTLWRRIPKVSMDLTYFLEGLPKPRTKEDRELADLLKEQSDAGIEGKPGPKLSPSWMPRPLRYSR